MAYDANKVSTAAVQYIETYYKNKVYWAVALSEVSESVQKPHQSQ